MSFENSKTCKICGNSMIQQAQMFQLVWVCTKCGISDR
jgi:ribosomal protein L37AE/L43A